MVYLLQGRYKDALHQLEVIGPGEPKVPWEVAYTADAHFALGNSAQASELYRKAADIVQDGAWASDIALRAYSLARLGDWSGASESMGRALEKAPGNINVVYQAALVYAIIGEEDLAWQMRHKAEELGCGPCWFQEPWWRLQE